MEQKSVFDIAKEVPCKFYKIPVKDIDKVTRKREIIICRQIAQTLLKRHTKHTLETIGLVVGGKNHATVLNSEKTISNLYDTDKNFRGEFEIMENQFKKEVESNKLLITMEKIRKITNRNYNKNDEYINLLCDDMLTFNLNSIAQL